MTFTEFQLKVSQDLKILFHEIVCIKKQLFTRTSQLTNDGEDGINSFITKLDIQEAVNEVQAPEDTVKAVVPFEKVNVIVRVDAQGRLVKESLVEISDSGSIDLPLGEDIRIGGVSISTNGDKTFVHVQVEVIRVWTVLHSLNKYPSVEIINEAGHRIFTQIDYIDTNTIQIVFTNPTNGYVTLN